jgi:hypothetical protein
MASVAGRFVRPRSGAGNEEKETMTMSDTSNDSTAAKKPAYIAYSVRERGKGKKSKFTEIGVVFPHKDGKGFDVLYDAIPLSGRITLRVPESK